MKIEMLDHVAIHVADVERSAAFYREVLGLPQIDRPAFDFPGAWFALGPGGQQLHLIGDRNKPVYSHNRGNHFALKIDSVEAAERQLVEAEANYKGPRQRPDGAWQLFVVDPDGHYVELCDTGGAEG